MPHNICLTAKTICAIDLSNNISHISILLKIECFIKENEVKCKKAFIKVHTDKYPIIMLILWFFVGSPFVCWNNSFPQLLQQQIKATRGGARSNCTRSAHFLHCCPKRYQTCQLYNIPHVCHGHHGRCPCKNFCQV